MADVVEDVVAQVEENLTENMNNTTGKIPATPEGMAVAYGSLIIMALLPIFFGSFRSVKHHKEQKESGEKPETLTQKDAAMFPIIASAALFGLYIFFKILVLTVKTDNSYVLRYISRHYEKPIKDLYKGWAHM